MESETPQIFKVMLTDDNKVAIQFKVNLRWVKFTRDQAIDLCNAVCDIIDLLDAKNGN